MADLFGEWVPDEWIEEVFEACKNAPQHRYLFLTKNPERYVKLHDQGKLPNNKNMWYGSTLTKPHTLYFGSLGLYNDFFSIEPILEDFSDKLPHATKWVIIGAETGNRKNKVVLEKEWINNIAKEFDMIGVPIFMKDSLIPIVGEENMRREFPWDKENRRTENAKV